MGIFANTKVKKAAISPATLNAQPDAPKVQAAVGVGGVQSIGQFYQYQEGTARNRAMSLATVSRSRDLLASKIDFVADAKENWAVVLVRRCYAAGRYARKRCWETVGCA